MRRRLLGPLCCLASIALLCSVVHADPPREVPGPNAEKEPSTIKVNYAGPHTLIVVQGVPRVLKDGKPLHVRAPSELEGISRELADELIAKEETQQSGPDAEGFAVSTEVPLKPEQRRFAVLDGETLYVGIPDGNKFAKSGDEIARFKFTSNCANNSQFESDGPALTKAARERIDNALLAWTVSRHTVAHAKKLRINDHGRSVDVQLDFSPPVAVSPFIERVRMLSQRR